MKRFKFLRTGLKSNSGDTKWKIDEWQEIKQTLDICEVGFHCSKGIYQAFSSVQGELLAEVETKGKSIKQTDKECWQKMRVVRVWKWKKIDSILFSIYAARLVLKIYEDKYPGDDRPRKAIEAAETYAKSPTKKNAEAAEAARAAAEAARAAAWAAEAAAWAAAWAAEAAAWAAARAAEAAEAAKAAEAARAAAEAAAWAAAWAAEAAAWAAAEAAAWAAEAAIYKKLDKWMLDHLKELEEVKK